jgi:hypothetical protein
MIQAVTLDDGMVIYVEVREPVAFADAPIPEPAPESANGEREFSREDFGGASKGLSDILKVLPKRPSIEQTILSYTSVALNALKDVSSANVDKVTLEFGIKVGGSVGVPFVTEGTAESNLKVTVECSFPKKTEADKKIASAN